MKASSGNWLLAATTVTSMVASMAISSTAWSADEISSDIEKFSYAIGYQVGHGLKKDNIAIDSKAFATAIEDVLQGKQTRISIQEMQSAMNKMRDQLQAEKSAAMVKNQQAGDKFLAANKNKEGVTTLPSGLQYKIIKSGSGKTPTAMDSVQVHYEGTLLDGTVFDSSYKRGAPVSLSVSGVIKGWQEALQLMKEGDKWQLFIPSELAYGSNGAGGKIGPYETLIFDVELIKINQKHADQ